jgi:ketosteroid isomerase-like protein
MPFETPQDAEDAFYDALECADLDAMLRVWDSAEDLACLLPMTPLIQGPAVIELWRSMLGQGVGVEIEVRHLGWIEGGDLALHLVEERVGAAPGGPKPPPLYALKLYRRGADGWRLVVHQSSPSPPQPGSMAPPGARPGP